MRSRKIVTIMFLLIVLLCGSLATMATPAQAKTLAATVKYKKAKRVKTGTTTVKVTTNGSSLGYVKFTAPKKGKYTFTVWGLVTFGAKVNGKDIQNGYVEICKVDKYGAYPLKVKTQFGRSYTLHLCTKDAWDVLPRASSVYDSLVRRSTTVTLKKGETVYIASYFTAKKAAYKLKVKKI